MERGHGRGADERASGGTMRRTAASAALGTKRAWLLRWQAVQPRACMAAATTKAAVAASATTVMRPAGMMLQMRITTKPRTAPAAAEKASRPSRSKTMHTTAQISPQPHATAAHAQKGMWCSASSCSP